MNRLGAHTADARDPIDEQSRTALIGRLNELRVACGKPSFDTLARLSPRLRRSTIGDALSGRSNPSLELVLDVVRACGDHATRIAVDVDPALLDVHGWVSRWRALHERAPAVEPTDGRPVPAKWPIPRQLPQTAPVMFGRERELVALDTLSPGTVAVVTGMGGVGKTTLVSHWARLRRDRFPDGELWVSLRTLAEPGQQAPAVALLSLLRSLGLGPTTLPSSLAELSGLFRSAMSERKMLLVVDDVADVDEVRPLLPAARLCTTLVVSRTGLAGLTTHDGARRLVVTPLPESLAVSTLIAIARRSGHRLDERDALRLAPLCGGLPLALQVLAERLRWENPDQLHEELAGEHSRLSGLSLDDDPASSARHVLMASFDQLAPATERILRLLTLRAWPDLTLTGIATLAGISLDQAREHARILLQANLLEQVQRGTFRIHDLVRLAAVERRPMGMVPRGPSAIGAATEVGRTGGTRTMPDAIAMEIGTG